MAQVKCCNCKEMSISGEYLQGRFWCTVCLWLARIIHAA